MIIKPHTKDPFKCHLLHIEYCKRENLGKQRISLDFCALAVLGLLLQGLSTADGFEEWRGLCQSSHVILLDESLWLSETLLQFLTLDSIPDHISNSVLTLVRTLDLLNDIDELSDIIEVVLK
jgi:hypothetical protein